MNTMAISANVAAIKPDIAIVPGALKPNIAPGYYQDIFTVYAQINSAGNLFPGTESIKTGTLPLVKPSKLPQITPGIQKRIDCLMQTIHSNYPMLLGEYAETETLSVLSKKYGEIAAGTIVFERITNLATMYYVVINIQLDESGAINVLKPGLVNNANLNPKPAFRLKAKKKSLAMTIAKGIGGAILSKVGGFIGDMIVNHFFPEEVPDYFDQVYQEVARIVDQKIDANTILTINGGLHNLMSKLENEYIPAKQNADLNNKNDRDKLFTLLQKYDNLFLTGPGGMLGSLQDAKLANAGLGVFMLGAALQLGITQEMAFVDPGNYNEKEKKWKSPLESSYGKPKTGTVSKTAKQFADFADKTWVSVLDKRRKQVGSQKFSKQVASGYNPRIGTIFKTVWMARLVDCGVPTSIEREIGQDEKKDKNTNYEAFKRDAIPPYINQKITELTEDMQNPALIIADWRKLIDTPIIL